MKCPGKPNPIVLMRTPGLSGPFFQNVGNACVHTAGNFLKFGTTLAFSALAAAVSGEMAGVLIGTGSLTTAHTATIYQPDDGGIWRPFATNEPVIRGGRVVRNYAVQSEDLTHASWGGFNRTITPGQTDPNGGSTAFRMTATAASGLLWGNNNSMPSGSTVLGSWWIRRVTGTGTVELYKGNGSSKEDITAVLTSSWQRLATTPATGYTPGGDTTGISITTSGDEVDLWHPQYENIAGQSNQAPGEYVPTTTAAAQKVYWRTNGNSVASNVVTEGTGVALDPMPYYWFQPAATNSLYHSSDLSGWSILNATVTFDQVGLDGTANSASLVSDASGIATGYARKSGLTRTVSTSGVIRAFILKDSDTSRFPMLLSSLSGGTAKTGYAWLNTSTGATTVSGADAANLTVTANDCGLWWEMLIEHTDTGANTVQGLDINPAAGTVIGTVSVAATGSIVVGNVEFHDNKTIAQVRGLGPIFTTTAAASTDIIKYSFDLANHSQTDGAYSIELLPFGLDQVTNFTASPIMVGSSTGAILYATNLQYADWHSYDGTTSVSNTAGAIVDTWQKLGTVYHAGDAQKAVVVDGTSGTPGAYDGAYTLGSEMQLMTRNRITTSWATECWGLRNLRRYGIPDFATGKSLLEGLTA